MNTEYGNVFNQKIADTELVEILAKSTSEKPFLVLLPDDEKLRLVITAEQIPILIQKASSRGAKNIYIRYINN